MNEEGVDLSFARPGGAALAAAGKKFVARYLYADGEGGKGLDKDEMADYAAHGLELVLIYESTAQRALDGFAAGVADAQAVAAQLAALGLPGDVPVYHAIDFDITDAQKPVAAQYLLGAKSVRGSAVGEYGGYWCVKYMAENNICSWHMQTYAWSGGQWHAAAQLQQYLNGQNINGAVDLQRSKSDNYGQVSKFGGSTPAPTPAPSPSDVVTLGASTPGYVKSTDAAAGRNSNSTVSPGTYKVTNRANGAENVVRLDGTGGWWINPSVAPTPAPAPAGLAVGDQVVIANPVDVNGTKLNVSGTYTVMEVSGSRIVVGRGGVVTAAVDASHLSKVGSGGTVPTSSAQYVTVAAGWGLSSVAQAAGFSDAGTEGRWAAIAALNGSNNWRVFNASLKAGQSVRVR